jgi:hypothetical protein
MRLRFPDLGLFVALPASICQLALGVSMPRTADAIASFGIICHGDAIGGAPA